jgi:hypothetical protein
MPRILFRWRGHEPLNEALVALPVVKEEVFHCEKLIEDFQLLWFGSKITMSTNIGGCC